MGTSAAIKMISKASLLAFAVIVALGHAAKVDFPQTTSFSLALRVDKTDWLKAEKEWQAVLKFARDQKMTANTIMMLRTASDKITNTLKEFNKIKAEKEAFAAKEKAKQEAGTKQPAVFTVVAGHSPDFNTQIGVKPLKSKGSKRKNVLRYRASEVAGLLAKGKIDLNKPFLITDGVHNLDELREAWTAAKMLKEHTDVKVRYLSPVKAKQRRSFDKEKNNNPNEELEWSHISLENYFVNCFNLRGKPDFRRLGGAQTEHCEMKVPASAMDPKMSSYKVKSLGGHLGGYGALEEGRSAFVTRAKDLQPLVHEKLDIQTQLGQSQSNFFVFGSSGSGEQLRQEERPFVDGLIHGKRRWFLMRPDHFMKLRQTASEVLEAASAFMFFEQQLAELIEDHELGESIPYYDTNQLPGDIMYVPNGLVMTGMAMSDSISFRQDVSTSPDEIPAGINSNIWHPESGQVPAGFQFALCTGLDLAKAGKTLGKQVHPQMGAQVQQIMKQFFPESVTQNQLIISTLSECHAALTGKIQGTYCDQVWQPCVAQLEKNAKTLKANLPDWLTQKHAETTAKLSKLTAASALGYGAKAEL